jgi:uncharacterized protein
MPTLNMALPANTDKHTDKEIRSFYDFKNIAIVGMSTNERKPAYFVPKYLIERGFDVVPVNPTASEILGRKSYPSVMDIPQDIDIVDVFRRSEDVPAAVDDAIKKRGLKVIWMQSGIHNEAAEKKAKENGIDVVFNRCMMEEHKRLFGE